MAPTAARPSRAIRMNRRMLRMPSPNSLAATTRQPRRGGRAGASRTEPRSGVSDGSREGASPARTSASGGVAMVALVAAEVALIDLVELVADATHVPDAQPARGEVDGQVTPDRLRAGHEPQARVVRVGLHVHDAGRGAQGRLDLV